MPNNQTETRQAGVLLPVSALPTPYGVGDFGPAAYHFVDLLAQAGIAVWQLLPLNPLGYGNSPYQPYSSSAGDELYLSPELLAEQGLLDAPVPCPGAADRVDYPAARRYKEALCRTAFAHFVPGPDYHAFVQQPWVQNYAVFITFKKANSLRCWLDWPAPQRDWPQTHALGLAPYREQLDYELFLQYEFYCQWNALHAYATQKGVRIMGDLPMYVGQDSQEVWAGRANFLLDKTGHPTVVAGVPPDYFSPTGQRWGNPIYNWEDMRKDGFAFWLERLRYNSRLFDILRLDHFRALDTYWEIPAECPTAQTGAWRTAPGDELLQTVRAALPGLALVAEDLGDMRPEVYALRDRFGLPGMRLVAMSFDPDTRDQQAAETENQVAYTGTHDNAPVAGWFAALTPDAQKLVEQKLAAAGFTEGSLVQRMVACTLAQKARLAILPVQDILGLGSEGRLNTPGTLGSPNWEWRLADFAALEAALPALAQQLAAQGRAMT